MNEAIKASLHRAVEDAIARELDLILISGDLFDHKHLTYATESFLMKAFNRLAEEDIRVFYGLGNHDHRDRVRGFGSLSLPENVVLFDRPEAVVIEAKSRKGTFYRVVGSGYDRRWIEDPVIDTYPRKQDERITLGMGHTGLENPHYMPVSRTMLEEKGYDYFALGHLHQRKRIGEGVAYAGSLVGLDETEVGPRGGYLGRIDETGLALEAVDYSTVVRQTVKVVLPDTVDDLASIETQVVSGTGDLDADFLVLDLVLTSVEQERLLVQENRAFLEDSLTERLELVDLHIRKITRESSKRMIGEDNWLWLLEKHLENGRLEATLLEDPEHKKLIGGADRERLHSVFETLVRKGMIDRDLT